MKHRRGRSRHGSKHFCAAIFGISSVATLKKKKKWKIALWLFVEIDFYAAFVLQTEGRFLSKSAKKKKKKKTPQSIEADETEHGLYACGAYPQV